MTKLVVDFPSSAIVLVTSSARGRPSLVVNCSVVTSEA
jgi:hypothetical protein